MCFSEFNFHGEAKPRLCALVLRARWVGLSPCSIASNKPTDGVKSQCVLLLKVHNITHDDHCDVNIKGDSCIFLLLTHKTQCITNLKWCMCKNMFKLLKGGTVNY